MLYAAWSLAATAAFLPFVVAETREIWYNITYATANPDGLFERRVIGLNGTWPPPPVEINANDTLIVHAYNGLGDDNTSIHHHGMFFNSSSWYDGAVGVTQCGIPIGETFTYVIDTQKNAQTGTYWYHSHYSGQYVDGLRAPLIIHNTPEVYQYDEEFTVSLYDWYHQQQHVLLGQFLSEANPGGAEPVPKSAVIQFSQNSAYLPGFSENASLPFQAGKTYRLRLINMSALAMFHFWIDGHDMSVIEVDGVDVEEYPLDQVTLSVAQRVSVLVTARNDSSSNWLMHANMDPEMFDTPEDVILNNITSSIIYSSDAPVADATEQAYEPFPDQDMVPVVVEAQAEADVKIQLGVFFDTADNGINRAFFNNITYQRPLVPSLLTATSMGNDSLDPVVYGQTNTFIIQHGDNVELTVINWDAGFHPFHLHGHRFQLVSTSFDVSSDNRSINPLLVEGQKNPMRRDTVAIPSGGSRVMRFRADNPGAWFFHCHIEWHLESGLAATFIEAPELVQYDIGAPLYLRDQCAALGYKTAGNAAGINSTTDFTGLTTGPWPQVLGWHAKGIGALVACIVTAILGMLSIIYYAVGGQLDEDELALEIQAQLDRKEEKGTKVQRVKKLLRSQ